MELGRLVAASIARDAPTLLTVIQDHAPFSDPIEKALFQNVRNEVKDLAPERNAAMHGHWSREGDSLEDLYRKIDTKKLPVAPVKVDISTLHKLSDDIARCAYTILNLTLLELQRRQRGPDPQPPVDPES